MATEKYPQRNVNVPMDAGAVEAARNRGVPNASIAPRMDPPEGSNGSRRQVASGEWIDDRKIILDAPPSPSEDSPPEVEAKGRAGKAVPGSYDPMKIYAVKLGEPTTHAGRVCGADSQYYLTGATCTEMSAAIIDAVEYGDIPVEPNAAPSAVATSSNGNGNKKRKG